jgi:hypothetical protein
MSEFGEAMASPILLTGGTGTLRRLVVPQLRDAGRDVRLLSRHSRQGGQDIQFVTSDLATGEGIDARPAAVGAHPDGVGLVEVAYIAGLVLAGGGPVRARRWLRHSCSACSPMGWRFRSAGSPTSSASARRADEHPPATAPPSQGQRR